MRQFAPYGVRYDGGTSMIFGGRMEYMICARHRCALGTSLKPEVLRRHYLRMGDGPSPSPVYRAIFVRWKVDHHIAHLGVTREKTLLSADAMVKVSSIR